MGAFKTILAVVLLSATLVGCDGAPNNASKVPLTAVSSVELNQYLGKWYEIGRYPNRFERGCEYVTANYSIIENGANKGAVRVVNTCVINGNKEKPKVARGVAKPLEGSNNAVLAVNFAPFPLPQGDGNYHIIYLDADYKHAVVGEPGRKYLWLLARTNSIKEADKALMLKAATDNGFDLAKIEYVKQ